MLNLHETFRKAASMVLVLLPVLIVLDVLFPAEGQGAAGRIIPHALRMLVLLVICASLVTLEFPAGFVPGWVLVAYLALLAVGFVRNGQYDWEHALLFVKYPVWPLAAMGFYQWQRLGILDESLLRRSITALALTMAGASLYGSLTASGETYSNALAYDMVYVCGLLLLWPPSRARQLVMALVVLAVLMTLKRGALVSMIVGACVFWGLARGCLAGARRWRFGSGGLVLLAVAAMGVIYRWQDIADRWSGVNDPQTESSGRLVFWPMIMDHWRQGSWQEQVFGFGFNSVPEALERLGYFAIYAHSDWLGVLHDQGLLGVAVQVVLHASVVLVVSRLWLVRHPATAAMGWGYGAYLVASICSGHLGGWLMFYFAMLLGISCAHSAAGATRTALASTGPELSASWRLLGPASLQRRT